MPLFLLPFLVGGGLGFGGGFIASDGLRTIKTLTVIGALGYGAFLLVRAK